MAHPTIDFELFLWERLSSRDAVCNGEEDRGSKAAPTTWSRFKVGSDTVPTVFSYPQ